MFLRGDPRNGKTTDIENVLKVDPKQKTKTNTKTKQKQKNGKVTLAHCKVLHKTIYDPRKEIQAWTLKGISQTKLILRGVPTNGKTTFAQSTVDPQRRI